MGLYTLIYIVLYLGIGLTIYFTIPNRRMAPLTIALPLIIAWLPISLVFLFAKKEKQKEQPKQ